MKILIRRQNPFFKNFFHFDIAGEPGGGGVLPYLTWDVPLNRVSFYGKNYATGCPFLIKIMRQGITIDKKIMRQGITWKHTF